MTCSGLWAVIILNEYLVVSYIETLISTLSHFWAAICWSVVRTSLVFKLCTIFRTFHKLKHYLHFTLFNIVIYEKFSWNYYLLFQLFFGRWIVQVWSASYTFYFRHLGSMETVAIGSYLVVANLERPVSTLSHFFSFFFVVCKFKDLYNYASHFGYARSFGQYFTWVFLVNSEGVLFAAFLLWRKLA